MKITACTYPLYHSFIFTANTRIHMQLYISYNSYCIYLSVFYVFAHLLPYQSLNVVDSCRNQYHNTSIIKWSKSNWLSQTRAPYIKQTDRQTDRQTDKKDTHACIFARAHTHTHTHTHTHWQTVINTAIIYQVCFTYSNCYVFESIIHIYTQRCMSYRCYCSQPFLMTSGRAKKEKA
jgi:hypothetical protein